jgi:hypothetical protein
MMPDDQHLDEVYEQLSATGPEFDGWLSNHGPMAADALMRMGQPERVSAWLAGYVTRLEPRPEQRWPIAAEDWRDPLGDPSRLGDWIAFFTRQLEEHPWRDLLAVWWGRLLPGAIASAGHALIRTGHAVRALGETDTAPRRGELAQALGYWAARWQPIPAQRRPAGSAPAAEVLGALPYSASAGGIRARLAALGEKPWWPEAQARLQAVSDADRVPRALDALVDATVGRFSSVARGNPTMLVHASTTPRAARLALAALPRALWVGTYEQAWSIAAAVTAVYAAPDTMTTAPSTEGLSAADIADRAGEHGDEHVIKFSEVAIESHERGNEAALSAALHVQNLIRPSTVSR